MTKSDDAREPEDAAELAYRSVRGDILAGHLMPGSPISQVKLASSLGISRTPLREALNRIAAEGLIVADFNRRMRVSELDLDDFDQIYAMRMALEPMAIAATVPRLSPDDRGQLRRAMSDMEHAIAGLDLEEFRVRHRAFHLGFVQLAGNRLLNTLSELWDHSERYRLAYLRHDYSASNSASLERLRLSQLEHAAMLEAADAGDATACGEVLQRHLRRTVEGVYGVIGRHLAPEIQLRAGNERGVTIDSAGA